MCKIENCCTLGKYLSNPSSNSILSFQVMMMVPMMMPADGSANFGAAASMPMMNSIMNPCMMPQPFMMPQVPPTTAPCLHWHQQQQHIHKLLPCSHRRIPCNRPCSQALPWLQLLKYRCNSLHKECRVCSSSNNRCPCRS
jgi:hypothetical protein